MRAGYLKQIISPTDLAQRTLGVPVHQKGNSVWYKSPFRAEERTASFEVTKRGFHDFGTNEHYDVIGYTQRFYSCSFKEAMNKLMQIYGLTDNEYGNERMQEFLKQQRLAMQKYREEVETWYNELFDFTEEVWKDNEETIKYVGYDADTLAILYDRQVFLGCLRETLLDTNTFQEKEKLKIQVTKEGLPTWMKNLKGYFSSRANWSTKLNCQKWC